MPVIAGDIDIVRGVLGVLGPHESGTAVVPVVDAAVQRALHDVEPTVRERAVFAIPVVTLVGRDVLPDLVVALGDREPAVRSAALQVLADRGPRASQAVPSIRARLLDSVKAVRAQAARALENITQAR